ncbi:MAG: hypothetical protein M3N82_02640, partial [Pseudomonadota bacterium]|nr:hypothetical protein [Pseudomonadota bacterium]
MATVSLGVLALLVAAVVL